MNELTSTNLGPDGEPHVGQSIFTVESIQADGEIVLANDHWSPSYLGNRFDRNTVNITVGREFAKAFRVGDEYAVSIYCATSRNPKEKP